MRKRAGFTQRTGLTLLALLLALPAAAQETCDGELRAAAKSYRLGRFEEIAAPLGKCLASGPEAPAAARANALLAKSWIELDELDKARGSVAALLAADPGFAPDPAGDPGLFVEMVEEKRREIAAQLAAIQVSTVSKMPEGLGEAPATVVVLSAEEIEQRGYLDLEQVIHDLPGFDISRGNGFEYSTLFHRGLRTVATDRTLLLIDGVEENELWSNSAPISRQYPLSNVERVEVVYGPASTIYGVNAFAGVINVVTRKPEAYVGAGHGVGAAAILTGGSWSTTSVDATVAGRNREGTVGWSFTGRAYSSDEQDLSAFSSWDYDPSFYDTVDYDAILGLRDPTAAQVFVDVYGTVSPFYTVEHDTAGAVAAVVLTEAGQQRARSFDKVPFSSELKGNPIAFSDPTDDRLVHGKLQLPSLAVGFQFWRREEGSTPGRTDRYSPGGDNGQLWVPEQTWLSVHYSKSLSRSLGLSLFVRYKDHKLDGDSSAVGVVNYELGTLGLDSLVEGVEPFWLPLYYTLSSNQLRAELNAVYQPSERLSLVGGLEVRSSSIQGAFVISPEPNPEETGAPTSLPPGGNRFDGRDIGLYLQASVRLRETLRLVAGGRLDDNQVRDTLGYGTAFSPRLALIYTPGDFVVKAIYSEAFKDPTNFQKYATVIGIRQSNPDLDLEDVRNLEITGSWKISDELSADVAIYESRYDDLVQEVQIPCTVPPDLDFFCLGSTTVGQFQNVGEARVRGAQATASYERGRLRAYGNYTYTDSVNTRPLDASGQPLLDASGRPLGELEMGSIASHQLNLGLTLSWRRLGAHLRARFVGARPTGEGTSGASGNPFREIDSYAVADTTVSYEGLFPGATLQLIVNNLFDEETFHPGPGAGDGAVFPPRSPQPERAAFLRLKYVF